MSRAVVEDIANVTSGQVVTFEDLGIRRNPTVRVTILGNVRTLHSLTVIEWLLLVMGLCCCLATFALSIYHFLGMESTIKNDVFACLLILNALFCLVYIVDGILREQPFEVMSFATSCAIVIVYVVISYTNDHCSSANSKLVRLAAVCVLGPIIILLSVIVSWRYWQSGNLIFRIVGADTNIQLMCRNLFTTTTLILFDLQVSGSTIVLSLDDKSVGLNLKQILTLAIAIPFVIGWTFSVYMTVRIESSVLFYVVVLFSPLHLAFVIWEIITTVTQNSGGLLTDCRFAACVSLLCVHVAAVVFLVKCYHNFGRGLSEKVYPMSRTRRTSPENPLLQPVVE